jgi:hypothetical protein
VANRCNGVALSLLMLVTRYIGIGVEGDRAQAAMRNAPAEEGENMRRIERIGETLVVASSPVR